MALMAGSSSVGQIFLDVDTVSPQTGWDILNNEIKLLNKIFFMMILNLDVSRNPVS